MNSITHLKSIRGRRTRAVIAAPFRLRTFWTERRRRRRLGKLDPVFVVGSGNTGTTIMRAMLGTSPDALALDRETGLFHGLPDGASAREWWSWLGRDPLATCTALERLVADDPDAVRLVEKTPTHAASVEQLFRFWPRSTIVVVTRNPLDVATSWARRDVGLDTALDAWIHDLSGVLPWVEDRRVHVLAYESFAANLKSAVARMWEVTGLTPGDVTKRDAATVRVTGGAPETPHVERRRRQVSAPLDFKVGAWRDQLTAAEVSRVTRRAGRLHADLCRLSQGGVADLDGTWPCAHTTLREHHVP